jgi:hypothetical protein
VEKLFGKKALFLKEMEFVTELQGMDTRFTIYIELSEV